ncbi:MAG: trypsin-like peptidase domain-containing protein [Acidobacteriota bacterium]|nr:trypsin-like peptidase domain-containing protein [Acidobacteriota bacterium]
MLFDPQLDVAVLSVPHMTAPPVQANSQTPAVGAPVVVLGYPLGGPLASSAGVVKLYEVAQGPDIYNRGTTKRLIFEVTSPIEHGYLGGPVVSTTNNGSAQLVGSVVGIVFARDAKSPHWAYAIPLNSVMADVRKATSTTYSATPGPCLPPAIANGT